MAFQPGFVPALVEFNVLELGNIGEEVIANQFAGVRVLGTLDEGDRASDCGKSVGFNLFLLEAHDITPGFGVPNRIPLGDVIRNRVRNGVICLYFRSVFTVIAESQLMFVGSFSLLNCLLEQGFHLGINAEGDPSFVFLARLQRVGSASDENELAAKVRVACGERQSEHGSP